MEEYGTMCAGDGCPLKGNCQRFTEFTEKYMAKFLTPPYTMKKDMFDCEFLITKNQTNILKQIEEDE
jgi:hypothetical protein